LRFVTWNVNHRARPRAIPGWLPDAIQALAPDLLVLTEYVSGPPNYPFAASLGSLGLPYVALSPDAAKENRVLIASRTPIVQGSIRPPEGGRLGDLIAPSLPSNFLHVVLPQNGLEVIGMRVPDYSKQPPIRRACWDWLGQIAATVVSQPSVILGDFNADPSYPRSRCGDRFAHFESSGWQHSLPDGASYWTPRNHGVRIDHAFVSRHFQVNSASYVREVDGTLLAHKNRAGLPDHAALVVVLEKVT
jgi:exonuclease III